MRALRTSLTVAAALGLAPGLASAQSNKPYDYLTKNVPVFRGVDYDFPVALVKGNDPNVKAAVEACKVEWDKEGYTIKDGQGKIIRRFLDVNPKKTQRGNEDKPWSHLDRWSFYQDGFEVYRESDLDEDGSLDEVRWMNSGGTRIAQVKPAEGGGVQVVAWTRISAEEASKVLVQAIANNDLALLESVLATPIELQSIGAPKVTQDRVTEAKAGRAKALKTLRDSLKTTGWSDTTAWSRFDGAMPRVIPADADHGLKDELLLYENVVIFADAGNAATNAKMAYLSVPEVVKIGDTWKFVDLPHAVDPVKPVGGNILLSLRSDVFKQGGGGTVDPVDPDILADLAAYDSKPIAADADKRKVADWHVNRVKILYKVIAEIKKPEEKLIYQKQAVNDLCEAIQTDLYPEGLAVLDKLVDAGGKIGSFAAYRKILAQFELAANEPGSNLLALQKANHAKFEQFLTDFAKSDEEPEVLLQLAAGSDFNDDEADAKTWYTRLAKDHAATEAGKKAAGALRRLGIDGKGMKLTGTGVNGKTISLDDYKGKPVLVVYWTSRDIKDLGDLGALKDKKGFEVVAVNLDGDKATADAAVKEIPSNFATIVEPEGMEGRLANEMGIISTPTMILIDAKGVVANRKIRKATEVERALDKNLAGRGVGLNSSNLK